MATLTKYTGSPDIFEGNRWISEQEARGMGAFTDVAGQINPAVVQELTTLRPDLRIESDFARLSQRDIGWNPSPVGSSDQIRNQVSGITEGINNITTSDINAQMQNILNSIVNPGQTDMTAVNELERLRQGISGPLSTDELSRARTAGIAAGAQYDPLIARAEEERRVGMPRAIVGAGERGGFMSTQYAGRAALQPTEGGGWVGAGGELERIKSQYDFNISQIQIAKNRAIQEAEASMGEFIRSGRQQDLNAAQENFRLAQQQAEQQSAALNDKLQALMSWQRLNNEMNQPILEATEAIQDFALDAMRKYTSGFTDLKPEDYPELTMVEIQRRILGSEEYKAELANIGVEAPRVIGSATRGFLQWDSKTGTWKSISAGGTRIGIADSRLIPDFEEEEEEEIADLKRPSFREFVMSKFAPEEAEKYLAPAFEYTPAREIKRRELQKEYSKLYLHKVEPLTRAEMKIKLMNENPTWSVTRINAELDVMEEQGVIQSEEDNDSDLSDLYEEIKREMKKLEENNH